MKKSKILLGLLGAMLAFVSCSSPEGPKVKYYNPRSTETVLKDHVEDSGWTDTVAIPAKSEMEIEMDEEKVKRTWFQTYEGVDWWLTLWYTDPIYLDVTTVEMGKEYVCLNSSNVTSELNYTTISGTEYYNIAFHKVMDAPDGAFTFDYELDGEVLHLRRWPDLNAWFNDEAFVKNNLGKKVTARADAFEGFTSEKWDYSFGWPTEYNGTNYKHYVDQYGYTKK